MSGERDSGNGDSSKQTISRVGAIKLVLRELGLDVDSAEVRHRVQEQFGYEVSEDFVEKVKRLS